MRLIPFDNLANTDKANTAPWCALVDSTDDRLKSLVIAHHDAHTFYRWPSDSTRIYYVFGQNTLSEQFLSKSLFEHSGIQYTYRSLQMKMAQQAAEGMSPEQMRAVRCQTGVPSQPLVPNQTWLS